MTGRMVALADGRQVLIRALGPQDAVALGDVYAALGHRDQRMRFSRSGLPAAEAHALAAAELGRARCGVIAFDPGAAPPRPVAAAVCVPDGTGPAEVALAVLGSHQGARLGRALLSDLLAAACQAGLPVLRAVIRRDNAPALSLFRSLGCLLVERPGPDELVIEIATDGTMPGWPGGGTGLRVLVESRGWTERPDTAQLRAGGAEVRQCAGPDEARGRDCPLLEAGQCAAAEGADVIVLALPPGDACCTRLRAAHDKRWPGRIRPRSVPDP